MASANCTPCPVGHRPTSAIASLRDTDVALSLQERKPENSLQTVQKQLEQALRAAIRAAFDIDADPLIGIAQNEKFGDYQSNAAMGLAKLVAEKTGQKTNPRA